MCPVCADILDNLLALRLLLVHNRLSSYLNRFLAIQGNCPPRAGFSFIGCPSVRAVNRLSDLSSLRYNRVSTQQPTE